MKLEITNIKELVKISCNHCYCLKDFVTTSGNLKESKTAEGIYYSENIYINHVKCCNCGNKQEEKH